MTTIMTKDDVLVAITASREKEEIVHQIICSNKLTNEEVECYLGEIIIKGHMQMEKISEASKKQSNQRKNNTYLAKLNHRFRLNKLHHNAL